MNEEQFCFFESKKLKITKPIRLIELFAGIGAQAKALENLEVPFEHYGICEFDKYAVKSYNAVHGTNWKTSDITKIHASDLKIVDTDQYCYILTYSFPCVDLSLAGKQAGMQKGSGTRSGLLWEVERLLLEMDKLPQILLMENVPQVHGTKNRADFEAWITFLESLGYRSVWKDLNAKDFGIPQNRNRCFMVSFLGDYTYTFPSGRKLELRLKDMLEEKVDEKYYMPDETVQKLLEKSPSVERDLDRELKRERERELEHEPVENGTENGYGDMSASKGLQGIRNRNADAERCSHTVRSGGRGSTDRHSWDLVYE